MACIELDDLHLTFKIREQYQITLKEYLLRRMYRKRRNPIAEIQALRGLTFQLRDGDRLGVIGANGSGKSTLLRVLAGIYAPTSGCRLVKGKVSSLFELSLGFEMEATGWKNIQYRGYLQGETPKSIRSKLQEIADFSELGRFLELPVRYYSAGMMVRLAFSIATAIEPEILLIDEVLSAGDLSFQKKAERRMRDLMSTAKIIVVVSHDLANLPHLCDRVLWLDKGRIKMMGPVHQVIAAYTDHVEGGKKIAAA